MQFSTLSHWGNSRFSYRGLGVAANYNQWQNIQGVCVNLKMEKTSDKGAVFIPITLGQFQIFYSGAVAAASYKQ